jgi:BirA family biotin operon repressor/biotin-[acetyl-CoA-carboxylase] ligase
MWGDLERPPLSGNRLRQDLAGDGFDVRLVAETASTNADLAAAARAGAAEGTVLVAEAQTAGRGRLDRGWTSPPRAGLTFSVLLRPPRPSAWLPLLTGLSLAVALREHAGLAVDLKWPNDVVVAGPDGRERKLAGILAEVAGVASEDSPAGVVIGVGLNVTTRADELAGLASGNALEPTSLALAGARVTDRETVLKAHLRALSRAYTGWRSDPGSVMPLYRSICRTLGRPVRLDLPGGGTVSGTAADVDNDGRLLVSGPAGQVEAFAAGDVVHLRSTERPAAETDPELG